MPRLSRKPLAAAVAMILVAGAARSQSPAPVPGVPRFINYTSPSGVGDDTGEPSIGINWTTEQSFSNSNGPIPNGGTVNYFGGFLPYMLKVTFQDCQSPAAVTWDQKPLLTANTPRVFGDPILFTDRETGRTFVTQEEGLTPAGSTTDITDNDGDSFSPSQGSGAPSCVDHETVGGGPFHAPLSSPLYPHAIYYASQCIADATIALSLDGGTTFGPSIPMWTINDCAGLHGHIKVGPDGTVYVPDKACGGNVPLLNGGEAAVAVSEDNGLTWAIRTVPGATTMGDDDPSVGVASDGSIYLGWQSADGHPRIAVSHDKGVTWTNIRDVGASLGIENCTFPEVAAGDGGTTTGRACFAFYGTTTAGGYDQPEFPGVWYLYIATTYDGGNSWITQNATPGDPIQRGGICSDGDCRNQLDFFDCGIDKEGRIVVGWDDGCIDGCVAGPPNSFTAKAVITRQSGGRRMFAAFDPVEPRIPEAPGISGHQAGPTVTLSWTTPDNGGATITGYKLYRRVNAGAFTLLATVTGNDYTDTVNPTDQNVYKVTAVNGSGEGPWCQEFTPGNGPIATACELPGLLVVNDLNPDGTANDAAQNTPPLPTVDLQSLKMGEAYAGPGVNQVTFTLQLGASTGTPPPLSQWYIIWNRHTIAADGSDRRFVAMKSNASGVLSFVYGDFGPPLPLDGTLPPTNANTPTVLGNADAGSYDVASGVVTIRLADSKLDATPIGAGSNLPSINVRSFLAKPDAGPKSQNVAADITGEGSYTLVGNGACFCTVDTPPVARLAASPDSGVAPLSVQFDASSSSDPDGVDGDAVASYRFDFGDGSPAVTQSSPMASHTYNVPSPSASYFASVTVKDEKCDRRSLNIASANIRVTGATSAVPVHPAGIFRLTPLNNPARGRLDLSLQSDQDGPVEVSVFDVSGRRIAQIADGEMEAGSHPIHWSGVDESGRGVPSGVYLIRAKSSGRIATSRILLIPS